MDNEVTIAAMRLVGGHAGLDLANTIHSRGERWGPDLLRSYGDLIDWAVRAKLFGEEDGARLRAAAESRPDAAEKALGRAKGLREAIHGVFRAEAEGEPAPENDLALLRQAATNALRHRALVEAGGALQWGWEHAETDLDTVADRVAFETAQFLVSRHERRAVRRCTGQNCGWLFLDTSKGGRRRWCSDEACGSHSRVRRFRANRVASDPD